MIRNLPRLIGKPRAILHDKGKRDTLLYVFDVRAIRGSASSWSG